MSIQHPPQDLIVIRLPFKELLIDDELKAINETVAQNPDCDVIIDFSRVEVIISSSLSNLLILQNLLAERGRRLILCNVSLITKCVFRIAGFDETFEFANDRPAAVAAVHNSC